MSQSISDFLLSDQLPPRHEIETICLKADIHSRGIVIHKSPDGPIVAWAKYGVHVAIAEALTQDWVARILAADPTTFVHVPRVFDAFMVPKTHFNIGIIIMEYIALPDCGKKDSELVAKAVQRLHCIKAPSLAPGPVGRGPTVHPFFVDRDSDITYMTVGELEEHVNGVSELHISDTSERVVVLREKLSLFVAKGILTQTSRMSLTPCWIFSPARNLP